MSRICEEVISAPLEQHGTRNIDSSSASACLSSSSGYGIPCVGLEHLIMYSTPILTELKAQFSLSNNVQKGGIQHHKFFHF